MNIFKRFKNIWKLSEFRPQFDENSLNVVHPNGKVLTLLEKPVQKMAQIIKRTTPTENFLNQNE